MRAFTLHSSHRMVLHDWTLTAVKLSVPSNYFLRSITCPVIPHSGIPFDMFAQNNHGGVANAEEYSFYFGADSLICSNIPFFRLKTFSSVKSRLTKFSYLK
jgi:hypothetical protein